ncbi:MAG: tetratricopeptide repeat protein [Elusimicrobia bacterium]|nr:tetratricopeptide repeat protein [Elusimicrobiota bacterium]
MPSETWIDSGKIAAPGKFDRTLNWVKKNRETVIGSVVIALAVVLFAVYFFIHLQSTRETAWKNLFIAQQTGYGGDLPKAAKLLGEVETVYSNTTAAPYATLTKGDLLFADGKFKEAGEEYARLTARPASLAPFALYNLGKCREAQGDLTGAQVEYSAMLEKFPEHFLAPECHLSMAHVQEISGAKDAAKATYEKIVLLYPDTAWAAQAKERLTAGEQKAPPAKK